MKVLDLACQHGHSFEGWFGSEDDFQNQLARGLVQCPICDDAVITKKLSAPRLNIRGVKRPGGNAAEGEGASEATSVGVTSKGSAERAEQGATKEIALGAVDTPATSLKGLENTAAVENSPHYLHALMRNPEFQAAYMAMAKEVLAKTDDVGNDFAREARKIHYGKERDKNKQRGSRGIRGQATHDETMALLDEGIDVMPLPLPSALKNTLQ